MALLNAIHTEAGSNLIARSELSGWLPFLCLRKLAAKLLLTVVSFCIGFAQGSPSPGANISYNWKPLKIGGTGWVTGVVSHPTSPTVRLARTDVGGFYRWDDPNDTWEQLATIDRFANVTGWEFDTGVESVAIAPTDPNTFYVAFLDRIFRSTDGGDSFQGVGPSNIPMEPNGTARQHGERLVVDPVNADIAYFGSVSSGLYRTTNGTSWSTVPTSQVPVGSANYGTTVVKFDPSSPVIGGATSGIYAATAGGGIYQSTDAGSSWNNLAAMPGGPSTAGEPSDLELHPDGSIYVTYHGSSETGIWRYRSNAGWGSGGSDWQKLSPSSSKAHMAVAIDPFDSSRILTGTTGLQDFWLSEDTGSSWRKITFSRSSPDIPWAEITSESWFSTGEFYFDPLQPGKMRVANGIGVWEADASSAALSDDHLVWEFDSNGIEELVTRDILAPPGGNVVTFGWDRTAFHHTDPDQYNATQALPFALNHGWDGSYRPNDTQFMVTSAADDLESRGAKNRASYSTDGGQTWTIFRSILFNNHPEELKYGNIAAGVSDATYPDNIVWAPTKGTGVRPYYSNDRGNTWTEVSDANWPAPSTGFVNPYVRPQLLIADPHQAGAYYFQVPDYGLVKSEDGGESWSTLFTGFSCCGYNGRLLADPDVDDKLWYAHGRQNIPWQGGLWKSTDGGGSFTELMNVDYAIDVALGKAAPDSDFLTLYLLGEVSGEEGIFRSIDDGLSWDSIGHYPLGIFDKITVIEASMDEYGLVYIGFGGTGFAYGQIDDTLDGDFDGDGDVDGRDFLAWQRGESSNPFSSEDLSAWQQNFGIGTNALGTAVEPIPEPPTAIMSLFMAGLLLCVKLRANRP